MVEPGWRAHFARVLRLSRSCLYAKPTKQAERDAIAITELKAVSYANPYYGVARFALDLGWSEKKARRIRTLSGVVAAKRSKKNRSSSSPAAEVAVPPNALKSYVDFKDPDRPQDGQSYARMVNADAWVQDFTHVDFMGMRVYIATVLILKTRQILGWSISLRHDQELVYAAILDALSKYPSPSILHSDQGTEYLSYRLRDLCLKMEITLSCSDRGSPWQNGFKERFYSTLKDELGDVTRFKDIAQLHEGLALTIYYYNHKRIHTSIKMSPAAYAAKLKTESVVTV
jgi:putative transposase